MLLPFEILAAVLVLISFYEYVKGTVLDLAFMGVLARGQHTSARLLVLLLAKLVVWISVSGVVFLLLTLETRDLARASLRQTFLVLFIIVIVPIFLLRKPYAKWVARTSKVPARSK